MKVKLKKKVMGKKKNKKKLVYGLLIVSGILVALLSLKGEEEKAQMQGYSVSRIEKREDRVLSTSLKSNHNINMEDQVDLRFNNFNVKEVEEKASLQIQGEETEESKAVDEVQVQPIMVTGKRLDVELICQLPELFNGCEVTSVAMLLNYKGIGISKLELADKMIKDETQAEFDDYGNITVWGNPNIGFVGDVTGNSIGYAINPEPLMSLVNEVYSGRGVNLTGSNIDDLKASIDNDNPVLVWIDENFTLPVEYVQWRDLNGNDILAYFSSHTVLLTGYDENNFYYNDPYNGYKDASVDFETFEAVWNELGKKALSVQ